VFPKGYNDQTMQTLQSLAHDIIEMEQYLDFLRSKMFRQTLLCHDHHTLQRTLTLKHAIGLNVASRIKPASEAPDINSKSVEQFRSGNDEATLSTDHPVSKAALVYLAEVWPRAVSVRELLNVAREKVQAAPDRIDEDAQDLLANLLKAYTYSSQLVELHTFQPSLVTKVTDRPVASPIARVGAEEGTIATNLWHERVNLTPLNRQLLRLLDGTRDHNALLDSLVTLAVAEVLHLKLDGQPVTDNALFRPLLERELEPNLNWLARAGTLVA
ncbi:MAG TPA: methyltransferase regulatory domain-containing protein, partial [Anaerolineae bacterium]